MNNENNINGIPSINPIKSSVLTMCHSSFVFHVTRASVFTCNHLVKKEFLDRNLIDYALWKLIGLTELLLSGFRSLSAVFGTCLSPVGNACGIQRTADDVVSGTGKVFDTAAADKHNGVLLKVVAFTRDVARYLDPVGKTNPGDLTKRGIRLLGRSGLYSRADTPLLRWRSIGRFFLQRVVSFLESRSRWLLFRCLSAFSD